MSFIAVIGGGPAGLMAANLIAAAGHGVRVYDQMPSVGRKFLMAGLGGLNLTHSEEMPVFLSRYGAAREWLEPVIRHFSPDRLRDWCHTLGQPTFVGSSGRVFPQSFKASPLLRAWLKELDERKVNFALKHRWMGWDEEGGLIFDLNGSRVTAKPVATVLALGGASWPRLGSNGGWVDVLRQQGVDIAPLQPVNCGFQVKWSDIFLQRFEGRPLKSVKLDFNGAHVQGEIMITAQGIEGGAVYALSPLLRDAITSKGLALLSLDLRPGLSQQELVTRLSTPRGSRTLSNHLRQQGGLSPLATGLMYEVFAKSELQEASPEKMANMIKHCPLCLTGTNGIERAISSTGGISRSAVDEWLMLKVKPGIFVAGEMLDWEAPTGGYLLQACFSTAVTAAEGVLAWVGTS